MLKWVKTLGNRVRPNGSEWVLAELNRAWIGFGPRLDVMDMGSAKAGCDGYGLGQWGLLFGRVRSMGVGV